MRLGIIRPKQVSTEIVDTTFDEALKLADLKPGEVDYGSLAPHLHLVAYEFGLFLPPEETSYFAIGKNLTAGNAVLYGSDDEGNTIAINAMPPVFFFGSVKAIESAIRVGQINRPEIRINGELVWSWPAKAPWGPYAK